METLSGRYFIESYERMIIYGSMDRVVPVQDLKCGRDFDDSEVVVGAKYPGIQSDILGKPYRPIMAV